MSEDLAEYWKSFAFDRLGSPDATPLPQNLTGTEVAERLWFFLPIFKDREETTRNTAFDDRFNSNADILVGKIAFDDPLDADAPQAWRIVWERFVLTINANAVVGADKFMARLPQGLSWEDQARALWLRDLLGQARSIPPQYPGRLGPASVLEFPTGAPWRP